jgi:hypothetical protein
MTDVISKDSIIDMPDNSDMIAEAMKEVTLFDKPRLNTQWITSRLNIWCRNTSKKNLMKNMARIGTVWLAKTLLRMSATNPKTIFSSTKGNWPSYCTKLVDLFETYFCPFYLNFFIFERGKNWFWNWFLGVGKIFPFERREK